MAKFGREAAKEDLQRVLAFESEIRAAANAKKVRACVLAGILSRETRGLPAFFIGDGGHGCGPMQIDDRSFPDVCKEYKANKRTNADMIMFGAEVLRRKIMALRDNRNLARANLERAGIAAYNCGEGNVARVLHLGQDLDFRTTNKNYSADVLERADFFAEHFGG